MRRPVLRILLNAATVISVMLCLATVAMWMRGDDWVIVSRPSVQIIRQSNGILSYDRIRFDSWQPEEEDRRPGWAKFIEQAAQAPMMSRNPDQWVDHVGHAFGIEFFRFRGQINFYTVGLVSAPFFDRGSFIEYIYAFHVGIPCYLLLLLSSTLPVARLTSFVTARMKERARQRGRRCLKCGYDLRATPDRCPECGTPSAAG